MLFFLASLFTLGYCRLDFLQSSEYTLIWRSPASNDKSVSLWQPVIPDEGYYLLGDVMVMDGNAPSTSALVFKPRNPEDVSEPLRAEAIWNSSGDKDLVTVFKLYPASGYRCIGAVAVRGTQPDLSKYRCVKSTFLKRAAKSVVWDAKDTNLRYRQFYFFSLKPKSQGLPMNHFYISSTASVSAKFVVNSEFIQPYIPMRSNAFGVGLAPVQSSLRVISVKSSALWHSKQFSIYNPEPREHYHVVASSLDKDSTILVSGMVGRDIAAPDRFSPVFTLENSGATLTLWQVTCPEGFSSPGLFASNSLEDHDNVVCVGDQYLTPEKGSYWKYLSSDSNYVETLWEAKVSPQGSEVLDLKTFTHTPTMAKPYQLTFLRGDLMNQMTDDMMVTLSSLRFGDSTSVTSKRELMNQDNADTKINKVVTSWTVQGVEEEGPIKVNIQSSILKSLSSYTKSLAEESAMKANQLNNYYSFLTDAQPALGTSDERWGYLVTEKWLEIPFSGTLTPERAVSGRLYLLVVSPPLLDPEDRPEEIRTFTESSKLRKDGELMSEIQFP